MQNNHSVENLLDGYVSGLDIVDRKENSVRNPSQPIWNGSGNSDQGGLRPLLTDCFAVHAALCIVNEVFLTVLRIRQKC